VVEREATEVEAEEAAHRGAHAMRVSERSSFTSARAERLDFPEKTRISTIQLQAEEAIIWAREEEMRLSALSQAEVARVIVREKMSRIPVEVALA
jgi:hypothetical protein